MKDSAAQGKIFICLVAYMMFYYRLLWDTLHVFHRKTDYGGTAAAALAPGLHHDHFKHLIYIFAT